MGCKVTCAANSGVLQFEDRGFSRNRRYSIMYRPALAQNQTGVQSTGSRQHAFKSIIHSGAHFRGQSEQSQTIWSRERLRCRPHRPGRGRTVPVVTAAHVKKSRRGTKSHDISLPDPCIMDRTCLKTPESLRSLIDTYPVY